MPQGALQRLGRALKDWFVPGRDPERDAELLRRHQERCLSFRMLLEANNRALETMAGMEEALAGERPFGMEFVRGACTEAATDVYRIIRALERIAPGRHPALAERFAAISGDMERAVAPHGQPPRGPGVVPLAALGQGDASCAGGKAAMLGELTRVPGVRTPGGFVITAAAASRFLDHSGLRQEILRRAQAVGGRRLDQLYALSSSLQTLIMTAEVPDDVAEDVRAAVRGLMREHGAGLRLAVRSSALGEDSAGHSFAGQFRTELNVHPDNALAAYRDVMASLFSATAIAYRHSRGLRDEDTLMCVIVMPMLRCRAGGVAYTRNPLDPGDRRVVVSAVHGLPKSVVDGNDAGQTWRVARDGGEGPRIVWRTASEQREAYYPGEDEGLEYVDLDPQTRSGDVISDPEVLALARLALDIEAHMGPAQDIEWALGEDGEMVILQSRPLGRSAESAERPVAEEPEAPVRAGDDDPQPLVRCGAPGSPGVGSGPVHLVRTEAQALTFPDGAVLVAPLARPEWAALLPRAAALVCERGGVTGHLATVAREYGVPALFLCKDAAGLLVQGAVVTVDAESGCVLPGAPGGDARARGARRTGIRGTPVYEALAEAARLVVPLHLLDPAAETFRAESCRTLHDITRFCHERAVAAMFGPDSAPPLPQAAARRLVCGVAMQYWVVDLGGGFSRPQPGDTVDLDAVACAPLLALWRGMTARPWDGPPPVNARGFMSVLAEAASNPELEAASRSVFAERNYFMISRTFCNLQSRFGFHFCTVEAEAGPDPTGNYAAFRFAGGAADKRRRELRARFVGELLEARGMRVDLTGDAMLARIENVAEQDVLHLLAVIGHLIVHTRQLDMIMADPAESARRTRAIENDLRTLFHGGEPVRV